MSMYLGKDNTGEFIFHVTSSVTDENVMKSSTAVSNTIYHSKGNYLEVHRFDAVSYAYPSGGYTTVEFNFNAMYDLYAYYNSTFYKQCFLIIASGKVVALNLGHYWGTSHSVIDSITSGYDYTKNFTWLPGIHTSVYMLVFNVSAQDALGVFPSVKATSAQLTTTKGITFAGRKSLYQYSQISNVINNVDPTFTDFSGNSLQVVNSFNRSGGVYPSYTSVSLTNDANGDSVLKYNNREIITSNSNMWKVPIGSVITVPIPLTGASCYMWGTHYTCDNIPWAFPSWINSVYTITTLPSTYTRYLIVLTFNHVMFRGGNWWTFQHGNQTYTFLVTKGGSKQKILNTSADNVVGPDAASSLYIEYTADNLLQWSNIGYGSNLGGYTTSIYDGTFYCIPVG